MITRSYPRTFRLLKSSQFQALSKNSHTFYGKSLFIVCKPNDLGHARLGITVTRKYANAVGRNRFKRRVREGFRLTDEMRSLGVDIHVRPKIKKGKGTTLPSFEDIRKDLQALVDGF